MNKNFKPFFNKLLLLESTQLTNIPDDDGGLTCCGISKVFWPEWEGWDRLRGSYGDVSKPFTKRMVYDRDCFREELLPLVEKFYKEKFWDSVSGDILPSGVDAYVALAAVNLGVKTACKLLQGTLRVEQDGILGVKTLTALNGFTGDSGTTKDGVEAV